MNQSETIELESHFDHLTALICSRFGVPFGLVTFVESAVAVFRGEAGIGVASLPREASVGNILVSMGKGALLVVEDARDHPVLKDHPFVVGGPRLRFFAGATVCDSQGQPVGAVGIMDSRPRSGLDTAEIEALHRIADIAGAMNDQAAAQRLQTERLALLELAEQMSGVGHWRFDLRSGVIQWSDEVYRIHGFQPGAIDPSDRTMRTLYHPDDVVALDRLLERAVDVGEGFELRVRFRTPDGDERLANCRATTERDNLGRTVAVFGVFRDVTIDVRAQERLAESEALFRLMNETATDIISRSAPDGTFRYLSPSVETVMGRTPGELIGQKFADYVHPDDHPQLRAGLAACVAAAPGAKPQRFEYRAFKPDGTVVWLEASPRPAFDLNGELLEFHDHVRDITTRKEAERVQTELLQTLSMAEELGGVGSWRLDVASGAVTWSDEVYRIHGKSRDTFDPSFDDAVKFYHPDDRQTVADCCRQAIETGIGGGFQLRIIREDGDARTVLAQCRPECDQSGTVVALFGVFQDVTDSLFAQDRIAASEARYRLLADNATDIIATFGMDGVYEYVSPAIEGVTGYRAEELVGQSFRRFIHPGDIRTVRADFAAYAKAGPDAASPRIRYRGVRKDGQTVWLEAHPRIIRNADGKALAFQDVVRDVSATKALEDELIASRNVAEAAARTKSEFLANMSHELRTPLTSVIGFSGLLQASTNLPESERRYADRIARSSEALLGVINDILDYSKLEAEAVDLEPQPFNPAEMARGAVLILEAQTLDKGLDLVVEVAADLPGALMGDEGRLRQVTLNFLSNAVKFTQAGEIRVEVSMVPGGLRVAVIDQGIGIAADKLDQLFDRFTQVDASTTRVYGGTGLGLAISRRLIGMMGGRIGAESRPGEGSTFWFEVPLAVAEETGRAVESEAAAIPAATRILLADDAVANRELVTALLSGLGLELDVVCDGAEAVEAVRTGAYDLVLMDVHMPVMDGLDATRAIRALGGPLSRTPIIALSANVQPEQVERCLAAGMDGHVGKPINIADLLNSMAAQLARPEFRDCRVGAAA